MNKLDSSRVRVRSQYRNILYRFYFFPVLPVPDSTLPKEVTNKAVNVNLRVNRCSIYIFTKTKIDIGRGRKCE